MSSRKRARKNFLLFYFPLKLLREKLFCHFSGQFLYFLSEKCPERNFLLLISPNIARRILFFILRYISSIFLRKIAQRKIIMPLFRTIFSFSLENLTEKNCCHFSIQKKPMRKYFTTFQDNFSIDFRKRAQ